MKKNAIGITSSAMTTASKYSKYINNIQNKSRRTITVKLNQYGNTEGSRNGYGQPLRNAFI